MSIASLWRQINSIRIRVFFFTRDFFSILNKSCFSFSSFVNIVGRYVNGKYFIIRLSAVVFIVDEKCTPCTMYSPPLPKIFIIFLFFIIRQVCYEFASNRIEPITNLFTRYRVPNMYRWFFSAKFVIKFHRKFKSRYLYSKRALVR